MIDSDSELSQQPAMPVPFVTYLLCGLCAAMFLWQLQEGGLNGAVGYPGYVDGVDLFQGKYWGLLTSFFFHGSFMHVAFNVYWLYHFGRGLEPYLGWKRYLLFWLAATLFSSMTEVLVAGDVGVGASGFCYSLFGFVWVGSYARSYLGRMLDTQTVVLFVLWLFGCIFLTWTGTMAIANGAHFGGILYGAMCAYVFLLREDIWLKRVAIAVTVICFFPLVYAPWLSSWNLMRASRAYDKKDYKSTLAYLDRVKMPEYELYTTELRGISLSSLGRNSEAAASFKSLLTSHKEDELSDPTYVYNEYAWILATSPDEKLRNPEEAIRYAKLACEKGNYKAPDALDTLAAAYASASQFDQAVIFEQKAIDAESNGHDMNELKARLKLFQAQKPYYDNAASPGA